MNTTIQRSFLILLLASSLLLPACGSKSQVKSQSASETVLNPESTPVSDGTASLGMPGEKKSGTHIHAYVEKVGAAKTSDTTVPAAANAVPAPASSTPMEASAPAEKKSGSHWVLWLLALLAVGGVGYVVWSKKQSEESIQPMPPVGGLSPVSGFTAVRDQIEEEAGSSKPSFWSKKLF